MVFPSKKECGLQWMWSVFSAELYVCIFLLCLDEVYIIVIIIIISFIINIITVDYFLIQSFEPL